MRVAVVGTGLIGGSVGLALTRRGHEIAGFDLDHDRLPARQGARCDQRCRRHRSTMRCAMPTSWSSRCRSATSRTVVAQALDAGAAIVTDVGSVKAPVVAAVEAARPDTVGALRRWSPDGRLRAGRCRRRRRRPVRRGHVGADTDRRDRRERVHRPAARSCASSVPRSSRSRPTHHDVLVALVSHVPQLAASTLMDVATVAGRGAPHPVAARGGRLPRHDAHRGRASRHLARHPRGQPRRGARRARRVPRRAATGPEPRSSEGDGAGLLELLERARAARRNLPVGMALGVDLVGAADPGHRPPGCDRRGDDARRAVSA